MEKKCSFCGFEKKDFLPAIHEGVGLCKSCSRIAYEHFHGKIDENNKANANKKEASLMYSRPLRPHEIKNKLDRDVIGQDDAKKVLTVEIYNHYKRIHSKVKTNIPKNNILLIGESGCGKTHLVETISKIINIPMIIVDATTITETGYSGKDVDSILSSLIQEANGNISSAEKGIVFIDEVDKLAKRTSHTSTKDPQGEGVQQALLKMIEGTNFTIEQNRQSIKRTTVTINTSNILFIFGGAFDGLQEIVDKRMNKHKKTIGFTNANTVEISKDDSEMSSIRIEDLIQFGMIPEFIGRIPLMLTLNSLTKENLMDILVKPNGAIIPEYIKLFKEEQKDLRFTDEAIEYIATEALHKGLGARGMKGIVAKKMSDLLYDMLINEDMTEFVATKTFIRG
ncbi:ATP-dependent Clp protease ATP-binding subunit ClpX [Bacillus cereus group sp. BfR-BA-02730]|uniref:ATP-dependent Clp protease ATP-binding subunit ClpX n=1 Tax=Bacillus cereus group sp. BfR-BA-02730 TaxID=3094893 RepID=UPI0029C1FDA1|nr:ATP-dependent Clp protease ATP-binding subunit ClpX [Bacillus cereus group sp. BfR-BA-02730]MDX5808852.1 ATP-dependent Clp protease ATP-binding subunit ClpX [Bacillus cereus group sp. BfR-BA-02730]